MVFSHICDEGMNGFARLFMNTENRDFVIERLERQLKEKETELDDIKNNLRDSILREIRSDLKNDLDFNNRIVELEHKVQALSSNLNGIMDELLDQKSMLRSLKEQSAAREKKTDIKPLINPPGKDVSAPKVYRPETGSIDDVDKKPQNRSLPANSLYSPTRAVSGPRTKKESPSGSRPEGPRVSVRSAEDDMSSKELSSHNTRAQPSSNVRLNVRELPPVKKPEMPEPQHHSEYIIAETDDERKVRLEKSSHQNMDSCKYIVAEEEKPSCGSEDPEYESVEAREDEDAVVTITRRR